MPAPAAVLASSTIFAAVHFAPRDFPQLLALGTVLGFSYVRTRNLLTPMLVRTHAVCDTRAVRARVRLTHASAACARDTRFTACGTRACYARSRSSPQTEQTCASWCASAAGAENNARAHARAPCRNKQARFERGVCVCVWTHHGANAKQHQIAFCVCVL